MIPQAASPEQLWTPAVGGPPHLVLACGPLYHHQWHQCMSVSLQHGSRPALSSKSYSQSYTGVSSRAFASPTQAVAQPISCLPVISCNTRNALRYVSHHCLTILPLLLPQAGSSTQIMQASFLQISSIFIRRSD